MPCKREHGLVQPVQDCVLVKVLPNLLHKLAFSFCVEIFATFFIRAFTIRTKDGVKVESWPIDPSKWQCESVQRYVRSMV